ncbi:RDD family protein [Neisseria sp. Dent CA1/247]|nr:RDD family protein [Neisseria sp. Dent CA1/247]UOO76933.1 RDD family protein [Neisseria sp. Dent CA1/247]
MNENYPSNVHQPSEEVVDVEIASAGSRIVAYLLNTLLTILVYMPLFFAVLWPLMPLLSADMSEQEMENALATVEWGGIGIAFGLLVLLVYTVVQCWMMSKHGQSIGKRIMKIRLLKTDGTNPGFWYAVMVREVGFNIVLGLAWRQRLRPICWRL